MKSEATIITCTQGKTSHILLFIINFPSFFEALRDRSAEITSLSQVLSFVLGTLQLLPWIPVIVHIHRRSRNETEGAKLKHRRKDAGAHPPSTQRQIASKNSFFPFFSHSSISCLPIASAIYPFILLRRGHERHWVIR